MPGEDGLSLQKDTILAVAMGDRRPRVVFDTRLFLLPRGQAPTLTLTTVNLSSVKLTLARLSERNVLPFVRNNRLGEPVESYSADEIAERSGRVVWEGQADIPRFQANRSARTALPLPETLLTSGPGLYALTATAGDGTPDAPSAVQMILRTDLAPTVWRGADGLTVQVRGFSDVKPRPGVRTRPARREQRHTRSGDHGRGRRRAFPRAAAARRPARSRRARSTSSDPRTISPRSISRAPPSTSRTGACQASRIPVRSMRSSGWIAASTGRARRCR